MTKEKKVYLEILRLIAIYSAVYVHTGISAMYHFEVNPTGASSWIAFVLMMLSQACNIMFFMITGAVLLDKEETVAHVLKYRFLRMLIVVILFSLFQYYCNYLRMPEMGFEIPVFFQVIYRTSVISQYWFLYAYLALLLILPFLRILARQMKPVHFVYLFVLYVIVEGILPVAEYHWEYEPLYLSVPFLEEIIICPLIGYFADKYGDEYLDSKKNLLLLNAGAIVFLLLGLDYSRTNYYVEGRISVLNGMLLVIAAAVFANLRFLCKHWQMPLWCKRVVLFLGSGAFGVYLFEPQLREGFYFLYLRLEPYVTWLPAAFVWLSAAVLAGILIFHVLKKIPFLGRLF